VSAVLGIGFKTEDLNTKVVLVLFLPESSDVRPDCTMDRAPVGHWLCRVLTDGAVVRFLVSFRFGCCPPIRKTAICTLAISIHPEEKRLDRRPVPWLRGAQYL